LKANAFIHVAAVTILGFLASPMHAAEPADVADLFPPGTLAYAELTNPAELAPQLAAVFKGTVLEDSIPFIHKRKDAATTLTELQGKRELAGLGLLASPEMMAEFKKLRGVAVGLVGFSTSGEPEVALVVLTGDSPAAGLAARAFLTMTATLRKVGEVSKVPVFQYRVPNINYDMNGVPTVANDKPPVESSHDLTFAYTPGLFVVGSSKLAVSHSIKRFLGEEKGGLATTLPFKEAAAIHRQTGVFYFVNFPELAAKFDSANKSRGGMLEPDAYAWFKMMANAKAITSIAGNIRFRDGGVSATFAASFDPKQKSPLMEFLSGSGVNVELLHHARRPATMAFCVTMPEKNRATTVIGLLDAIAKANGELGRLPSDRVKELEEKYKGSVTDGLLGKTRAITVVVPTKQELPKGTKPFPLLILHSDDAATATAWEEFLPKLIADVSGAATLPQVSTETIGGMKVFSLPGNGLPWNGPIHYARNGTAVAIGLDRKLVAAAATPDPSAAITGGDKSVLPPTGDPVVLFGAVAMGDAIAGLLEKSRPEGAVVPVQVEDVPLPPGVGNPVPENLMEDLKKARKEFFTAIGTLSPATILVRRSGNELRVEVFQPKVQAGGLKSVIDSGANWLDKWGGLIGSQNPFGMDGRNIYGKW
jgi:hypothetical protein